MATVDATDLRVLFAGRSAAPAVAPRATTAAHGGGAFEHLLSGAGAPAPGRAGLRAVSTTRAGVERPETTADPSAGAEAPAGRPATASGQGTARRHPVRRPASTASQAEAEPTAQEPRAQAQTAGAKATVSRRDDGAPRPAAEATDGSCPGDARAESDPAGRAEAPAAVTVAAESPEPVAARPADDPAAAASTIGSITAAEGETGEAVIELAPDLPTPTEGLAVAAPSTGLPVATDGSASTAGNGQVEGAGVGVVQSVAAGAGVPAQAAAAAEPAAAGQIAEPTQVPDPYVAGRARGAYADSPASLGRPRIQAVPVELHQETPVGEGPALEGAGAAAASIATAAPGLEGGQLPPQGDISSSAWSGDRMDHPVKKDATPVEGRDHARVMAREVLAAILGQRSADGPPPEQGAGQVSTGVAHAAAVLNLAPGEAPTLRQGQRWLEAALGRNGGDAATVSQVFEQVSAAVAGDGASGTGRRGADRDASPGAPLARTAGIGARSGAADMLFSLAGLPSVSAMPVGSPSLETGTVTAARDLHLAQQVVRAVSLAWRGNTGEAHVRLAPEHLGEVRVSLTVNQGNVTATLQAETPAARAWIQAHEEDLRKGLQEQGLTLERLVVTEEGERRGGQQEQEAPPRPRTRRQAASPGADAPRFELDA